MIRRRHIFRPAAILSLVALSCLISPWAQQETLAWGNKAHIMITLEACRRLPAPLSSLFSANRDFLADHSLDPDRRASLEKSLPPHQRTEGFKHYIDADIYGDFPFFEIPRSYDRAVQLYGLDWVRSAGTLPWTILEYTDRLSRLMRENKWPEALLAAAELSHYAADAHVPFHYTYNYDGQFSGAMGIHKRFEIDLVESFAYDREIQRHREKAKNITDVEGFVFELMPATYVWIDNILEADRKATLESDEFGNRYYEEMQKSIGEVTANLLRLSAADVASLWYTAWVNAGKPSPPRNLRLPKPRP